MYKQHNYYFAPHNCLAEELLLGSIILHPHLFRKISMIITADCFFFECHQIIYRSLLKLNKKDKLDLINLLYILYNEKVLKYIGGVPKIIDMIKQSQTLISSINMMIPIKELITIINAHHTKRAMIQYGYNIIQLGFIKELPNYILHSKASNYLDFTSKKITKGNLDSFQNLLGNFLLTIQEAKKTGSKLLSSTNKFLFYGFKELDKLTYGISNGDLIIIAGRPSIGKTSFAISIAYNIINNHHIGLCIFSLEMSKQQILNKLISITSKIPLHKIISNNVDNHEIKKLRNTCKELLQHTIYIYDTTNSSIDYIMYQCQTLAKNISRIKIIIIDYLQLIQTESNSSSTRSQELSYITRKLKILAQQLSIPILVLSQLNRSIESRINKTPLLSDLKESGCIKYNNFINIYKNNHIYIKYLLYKYQICYEKQNIISYHKNYLSTNQIYFSHKYCYKINLNNINTIATHNHLLLQLKKWLSQDKLTEYKLICTHITDNIALQHAVQVYFFKHAKVYDISLPFYRYFINNKIYVHNSIEQDADIVMILYKDSIDKNAENKQIGNYPYVINMKICKNRSGPTGYCKFSFFPDNTYFQDFIDNT